jgi:hypothetical protein
MSAQPNLRYTCKLSLKEIYRNVKFGAGKTI